MTSRRSVEIRQIEQENGYARTSAELFYRLEALVQEGFVRKRRIATDGQFSYALSDEFRRIADR